MPQNKQLGRFVSASIAACDRDAAPRWLGPQPKGYSVVGQLELWAETFSQRFPVQYHHSAVSAPLGRPEQGVGSTIEWHREND